MQRTNSHTTSQAIDIPAPPTANGDSNTPVAAQYASVEDRQRLRESLRSQLSITDQPITNSPHPNSLASLRDAAHVLATPADALRLEELMIMEAIRRSMRDLNVVKDAEGSAADSSSPRSPQTPRIRGLMGRGMNQRGSRSSSVSDADYDGDVHSVHASELFRSESSGAGHTHSRPGSHRSSNSRGGGNADERRVSLSDWNPFDD
jgi:hypothetical protein